MIGIRVETAVVMAGHFVEGRVTWGTDGGHPAHRIIVSAVWDADAFNGKVRGVGRSVVHLPQRGQCEGVIPVRLLIPHEGPVSFHGEVLTITWNIWVHIDRPGLDEFGSAPFRVVPRSATNAVPRAEEVALR